MSLPKTRKQGRFFWEKNSNFKIGKVILLLFFAMAISFLFMVFPSFSSERTFQVNLQADYISWSEDLSIVIGKGKVKLEYKDVQIETENVRIDLHTSELLAWDKVSFKLKTRRVEGENLRYNLEKEEGTIQHPSGKEGLFFYRAEEAFFSSEIIELRKAYFTSCELSLPHYKIRAGRISIRLDDEIVMSNVTFSLGDIPVFWLPFFVQYLREENRFILPSLSYNDFAGWSIQTGYYFYASPSFQAKLHLDYREEKGWAEGIDISYRFKGAKGKLNTYFIKEKDTQEERWLASLEHQQSFSDSTSLKLRLNRLSDKDFLKDYFAREYQTAYLYLAHRGPGYNASILAQPAVNPVFERGSVERLPQFKLNFDYQRINESYFYNAEAIEITNFKKDDKSILRADGFLDISSPWTDFGYFKLRPRIGYHHFNYWYEREGEKLSGYRSIPYQELNLFSEITVKSENYTHIGRLSLDYYHSSEVKDDFELPFSLGDYRKVTNAIHPENLIKLNLKNYLYSGKLRLLSGEVKANYDLTKEKFSPVEVKFHLTPPLPYTEYLDLHFVYDPYRKEYKEIKSSLGLKGNQWNLRVGMKRYPQEDLTDVTAQGGFSVGEKWRVSAYLRYDWEKKNTEEEVYSLWRDLHCWTLRLFLKNKPEKEYWIALHIKAFPKHWIKYHPDRELLEYQ
ncbi:hypothetical protein CEE34_07335 [Candidatus Aerophobetes bacterium Ae_b3a]|nr:MAG: hypothetical protein CEE34_07335 [Candidatus Aerophobetes bacterium Ae_b3a]